MDVCGSGSFRSRLGRMELRAGEASEDDEYQGGQAGSAVIIELCLESARWRAEARHACMVMVEPKMTTR